MRPPEDRRQHRHSRRGGGERRHDGVEVQIEPAAYTVARWIGDPARAVPLLGGQTAVAADRQERRVLLFASEWELQYFERQHPGFPLLAESPVARKSEV